MIALLRLHASQLRRMLGLWAPALLAAGAWIHWGMSDKDWDYNTAWLVQLIVAPLGLVAALRSDLVAWTVPVGRSRRILSHILFTTLIALLGAAGAMALLRQFESGSELPVKLLSFTMCGMLSAFALGGIYLLIEYSEAIVGWIALVIVGALDAYWTSWLPKNAYTSPYEIFLLGSLTVVAAAFYWTLFVQSDLEGVAPPAIAPPPPPFPESPEAIRRPPPRVSEPGLDSTAKPESREGKEVLGISAELRKGRSLGWILLRKNMGMIGFILLLQFGTMFLGAFGTLMTQQYVLSSSLGVGQSLKTWSFFTHTPLPRWKIFGMAVLPALFLWGAFLSASLLQVPYSASTRFLEPHDSFASEEFSSARMTANSEFGINRQSLHDIGFPDWKSKSKNQPEHVASLTATFLQAFFGIRTTPEYLLSLRARSSIPDLIADTDPQQTAWLQAIEERFQPELRWSLFRHRAYYSLMAFLFFACVLPGMSLANRLSRAKCTLLIGVGFAAYGALGTPEMTIRLFRICDALPWLTVLVIPALSGAAVALSYRMFREWTSVARREPLHLRFR